MGRTPPRLGLALALVAGALVAQAAVVSVLERREDLIRASFLFSAAGNVLAAIAHARRAREGGRTAAGFWLAAVSFALVAPMSAAGGVLGPQAPPALYGLVMLSATLLRTAGFLAWPWERVQGGRATPVVGATLFVGASLLLLWGLGSFGASAVNGQLLGAVQLVLAGRQALLTGVLVFLVLESPRRARGMLGWNLAGAVAAGVSLAGLQSIVTTGTLRTVLATAPFTLVPLLPAAGAWLGTPVDVPGSEATPDRRWLAVVFLPVLISGVVLAASHGGRQDDLTWPTVGFVVIAGGVVAMAWLLIRELSAHQRVLEARVADRTRQLEEATAVLLRNQRMNLVATLGAGVLHDLRNLLGVIQGHAELLSSELAAGPAPTRESVADIGVAADRATALLGRMMGYLRDERGPASSPVDLVKAVRAADRVLRALVPRGMRLTVEAPVERAWARLSPGRVEQILLNLVSNARQALEGGGQITVRVRPDAGDRVAIEVEDTGPGIAPEITARLFEPLLTTRADRGGTGLGLVSVKVLAEQDGGVVSVRTRWGEGTTVTVSYPAAPGPVRAAAAAG